MKNSIDKKVFEQARTITKELKDIEKKLSSIPKSELVGDIYGDYNTGHKKIRVMRGYSSERYKTLEKKYNEKVQTLLELLIKTEKELDIIDDSLIRDIFRLYYQNGMSESQISMRKGYSRSRISQLISEFWEKQNE